MEAPAADRKAGGAERFARYPDYLMPIAGSHQLADQRFAEVREEMLLGYGYNTARAYRSDLDDIHEWATGHGRDALALTDQDLKQYRALLRRRKYSENTIRRRCTSYRLLIAQLTHDSK